MILFRCWVRILSQSKINTYTKNTQEEDRFQFDEFIIIYIMIGADPAYTILNTPQDEWH